MAKFSPMEAVFNGLKFARARPATILIWSAFLLVVMTVASLALFDLGGDSMTNLIAATRADQPNMKQIAALMEDLVPASAFASLLLLVFGSVLVTAVLRVALTPGPHPWGGLRLTGEELRTLGVMVAMMAVALGAELLLGLVVGLLAAVSGPAAMALLIVGYLGVLGLMVRLSLAPVAAMIEKKVSIPRAFALTKGHFWRLTGAYVLLAAVMLVILMMVIILFSTLMTALAAATGSGLDQLFFALQHNYQDLNPVILATYVIMNLVQGWVWVIFLTAYVSVGVQAYKAMADGRA